MAEDDDGDKTELPTDHRRTEAREQGQIARSAELTTAASVLAATSVLNFWGADLAQNLGELMRRSLAERAWTRLDSELLTAEAWRILSHLAPVLLPILGVLMFAGTAVNLLQTQFLISPQLLQPDFNRINPLSGLQRIFSLRGTIRLVGSLLKLTVLACVATGFILGQVGAMLLSTESSVGVISAGLGSSLVSLSFQMAIALVVLAGFDYGFEVWKFEQDLMMSKYEVRMEMRMMDGNPEIRARRREIHRKLSQQKELAAVKNADFVVTNPTEIAVAIKYDAQRHEAPVIVAKGIGAVAARIRRIAAENRVPIVEKKPLARALYYNVKVGQAVPSDLYEAVAEVLAYVYRLSGRATPKTKAG